MILYSNDKKVVGISYNELRILGFHSLEDLNEFGIENLFIKKRGFIFDTPKYFWPEYVLSEVKQSFVIIKTEETQGEIFEIRVGRFYLNTELVYSIELDSLNFLNNGSIVNLNDNDEEKLQNIHSISSIIKNKKDEERLDEIYQEACESKEYVFEVEREKEVVEEEKLETPINIEEELAKIAAASSNVEEETVSFDEPIEEQNVSFEEEERKEETFSFDESIKNETEISFDEDEREAIVISFAPSIKSTVEELIATPIVKEEISYEEPIEEIKCQVFDIEKSSLELRLPVSIILEFLDEFLEQLEDEIPNIKQFNETQNQEKLELVIHKLKGAATNLRIDGISRVLIDFNNSLSNYEQKNINKYIKEMEFCYKKLIDFKNEYSEKEEFDFDKLNLSKELVEEFLEEFLETSEDYFVDIERNINNREFVDALEISYALEDLVQTLSFDFLIKDIIILQEACTNSNSNLAKETLNKIMLDVNTLKGIKI